MRITEISSRANDNIKLYRKLCESRKERVNRSLFTLEGYRLSEEALREGIEACAVFLTESFLKKHEELINDFSESARLFLITEDIAKNISETENPQGIFMICKMPRTDVISDIITENGRYIFLSKLQDTGNLGTIIRTADAMGIDGIICCGCCDIYNPKTVRSAMGSIFRMKIAVTDEDTAFAALEKKKIKTYAAYLSEYSERITDINFTGGNAVLIGNEGNGLDEETVRKCGGKLIIPMRGRAESLNASVAAAIIMWEMTAERTGR